MWSDILTSIDEDQDMEGKSHLEYFEMFHQQLTEIIQKETWVYTVLV